MFVGSANCSRLVSSAGGAGVPNSALLNALAANTGAGVSGGSWSPVSNLWSVYLFVVEEILRLYKRTLTTARLLDTCAEPPTKHISRFGYFSVFGFQKSMHSPRRLCDLKGRRRGL